MPDAPPFRSDTLSKQVADLLRERILGGDWPPGVRLPAEPELAQQLGVSRSVIRDATRTLAASGLIEVRHGIGTRVAQPNDHVYTEAISLLLMRSDATLGDLAETREMIETATAPIAACARDDQDCEKLEYHLAGLATAAEARDISLAREHNLAFHQALLAATHRPVAEALLRPMHRIIIATSDPIATDDPDNFGVGLHRSLLDAILAGDAERARVAMAEHFEFVHDPAFAERHRQSYREFQASLTGAGTVAHP